MAETIIESEFDDKWAVKLYQAYEAMFEDPIIISTLHSSHRIDTPRRAVEALEEMLSGCLVKPELLLSTFENTSKYSEMVHVKKVRFYSVCAHHMLPFFGTANFAYIPDTRIVGLSKISRLIDAFARRPQVQEKLTDEITETFQKHVRPIGCGVVMRAYHFCMICRGAREPTAYTETTSLWGSFLNGAKQEFLTAAAADPVVWG